ncbi:hypothetical protein A4X06_0g2482 [Tilletia controversa]|uniref:Uncharacterized protein n=1 Tax=Tilletia controversa TaxID=13291 RepID=A0A8X7SYQ7_9BASI|nr:hypothetical protein CF328_g3185 [Tilletia controversa]KAE8251928.1 hypothetical protein A4X06_0g2482 [Tilletia controversa]
MTEPQGSASSAAQVKAGEPEDVLMAEAKDRGEASAEGSAPAQQGHEAGTGRPMPMEDATETAPAAGAKPATQQAGGATAGNEAAQPAAQTSLQDDDSDSELSDLTSLSGESDQDASAPTPGEGSPALHQGEAGDSYQTAPNEAPTTRSGRVSKKPTSEFRKEPQTSVSHAGTAADDSFAPAEEEAAPALAVVAASPSLKIKISRRRLSSNMEASPTTATPTAAASTSLRRKGEGKDAGFLAFNEDAEGDDEEESGGDDQDDEAGGADGNYKPPGLVGSATVSKVPTDRKAGKQRQLQAASSATASAAASTSVAANVTAPVSAPRPPRPAAKPGKVVVFSSEKPVPKAIPKQLSPEKAAQSGSVVRKSAASTATATLESIPSFGVPTSATAKKPITKHLTKHRATGQIRQEKIAAVESGSTSAAASTSALPPPPPPTTTTPTPMTEAESVDKASKKVDGPYENEKEEGKARRHLKVLQEKIEKAAGIESSMDSKAIKDLKYNRRVFKHLLARLQMTEDLRALQTGGPASAPISSDQPAPTPTPTPTPTKSQVVAGPSRIKRKGQKLADSDDEVEMASMREPIVTEKRLDSGKGKKVQHDASVESKSVSERRPGPGKERAAGPSAPVRERSGPAPSAASTSASVQKRPGMSMAGAGAVQAAGKTSGSVVVSTAGKTSAAAPAPLNAGGSASSSATVAAGDAGPSAGTTGAGPNMAEWDNLLYGMPLPPQSKPSKPGPSKPTPDKVNIPTIPKKFGGSAAKSDAGGTARKGKGKAGPTMGTSGGEGSHPSAVIDMRDAEKVVEGGEEISDEQMAERRAQAMAEYDDDSAAVNLLGYDENIMLIEEEMHRWDSQGLFGDSRHFNRIGSFFGRESFLNLDQFLEVTDPALNREQQYERVHEIRSARQAQREEQQGDEQMQMQMQVQVQGQEHSQGQGDEGLGAQTPVTMSVDL